MEGYPVHACSKKMQLMGATHPLEDLLLSRVTSQNDVEGLAVDRACVDVLRQPMQHSINTH